jgi:hypothetical protein
MEEFLLEIWWPQLFLGFIVLAVAKGIRFGTPSWVRSYTTAGNYYVGLLVYVLFIGLAYLLLAEIIRRTALGAIKKDLMPSWLDPWISLAPLLIAFALLLLSRFRPLSSLEAWFRKKLYDLIRYPGHAYRLTEVLFRSKYERSGQIETEVRSLLLGRGYDPNQNWLPVADPMRDLWFKAAILFHQIRNWESNKRYRRFLSNARVEFDVLRQRFDQLSFKVPRVFEMLERLGILLSTAVPVAASDSHPSSAGSAVGSEYQETTEAVKTTISDLLSDLQEDVAFFLRNVCLFIARGVLSNSLTSSKCFQRLKDLGFTVETPCPSTVHVLLTAFIVFLISLYIPIAVSDPGIKGDFPFLFLIVMIATIQVIALATAILPKRRYGFANEDINGRPPWAFIIMAGLVALVFAALVSLGFRCLAFLDWSKALRDFSCNSPWVLMAFLTAGVSAFLIQDSRWASTSSLWKKRMKDALVMALSNSAMMVIVLLIFRTIIPDPCGGMLNHLKHISWILPLVAGFSIGFVIGLLVPSAFRGQGSTELPARHAAESS